ncbi:M28 family metallopeptidase [Cryobacterium sp. Hb1]|uniref:M28 family metallopeptidase n=1 Tax=Cryobacterium sp. Hb1 TaxID=1259147 RepID=UPI00106A5840|nr:M20/M25/M40 family metallo-hydrolase [Cryobacterium sp. Hb1]TFD70484.1 M20/M25/M40 family metallo-hydrolase [Cryobacterium sp. Hb1]
MTSSDDSIARDQAFGDLVALTERGIRFHGTEGLHNSAAWLEEQLAVAGLAVERQPVVVPGWAPGETCRLTIAEPFAREIRVWPLLWSGPSNGVQSGRLVAQGREGLWGDSIVWRRFLVLDVNDEVIAYVLGRETGPAAPQPLPSGSDYAAPHFAVSRNDSDQLSEWITDGRRVLVEFELDSAHDGQAAGDNLIVDLPGTIGSEEEPTLLICAHYDTFWNTPGAYDNGSGTIALLHLAKQWAINPPQNPTRLVFFTGEEWHLSGSRAYVAQAHQTALDDVGYVINIDGLGRGKFLESFGAPERFEVAFSGTIRRYIESTRGGLDVISRFPPPMGTDDAAFYAVGVPSGFMTFNDFNRLHQPEDVPNHEIAANIVWTVGLVDHLVRNLEIPQRAVAPGIL